ncbi:uncharacterized protein BP01DRAFT_368015 [Aspergillus saccharolyticus JOP 1030-1]|uniref:Arrestin-like N-terminal domain-containing protein n=1 Tax=Aspergillus saccharolyticus JOP 1030-1 TaxID=1450539 RepID=A0A318ZD84_9EURO|nr:hypothetical protein BP01DRAFT_368015 [Aspergillus saccharolyticus JOP 1030-1]PYH42613.1 hypothetical protein BP01DRAFT_368015 [Aspergillus saccharolyticus JOP 1030-1]
MSHSGTNTCIKAIQKLWAQQKVYISIDLVNERTYTTSDQIRGTATITTAHDVDFDHLSITFEGVYRVYNERIGPPHTDRRIAASKTFLKLRHPFPTDAYPNSRQFKKDETYVFPFSFVVPGSAKTTVCASEPNGAHTELPPSLTRSKNDYFTPSMCEVIYTIHVRITHTPEKRSLARQSRQARVVTIAQTYAFEKGESARMTGHIPGQGVDEFKTVAFQPQPIRLIAPKYVDLSAPCPIEVQIQYNPADHVCPPRLKALHTRLDVSTTYICNDGLQYQVVAMALGDTEPEDRYHRGW